MKLFKLRDKLTDLNNNKGVVLAAVVLVFVFISLLTTSVVAMVYSDNIFSQEDEKEEKAYFAARSAITTVEAAIKDELEALDDLKDIVKEREDEYSSNSSGVAESAWRDARDKYNEKFDFIMGTVLPTSTTGDLTHDVSVPSADFDTTSNDFTVNVKFLSDEEFRLESQATVNGKTKKVARILNIKDEPFTSSINLSQIIGLFDNAVWVKEDFKSENNTTISGNLSYGNDLITPKKPIDFENGKATKRTKPVDLPEPEEFFLEVSGLPSVSSLTEKTGDFYSSGNKITSGNSGSYSTVTWKKNTTYNVNTTGADGKASNVIYKFDSVDATDAKGTVFNVTGKGALIVYIMNIISNEGNDNNIQFKGSGEAEIYLIVNGDLVHAKNNFGGSNLYIFAPNSDIEMKNNAVIGGAIIANNMEVKNNTSVIYRSPSKNMQIDETNEGGTILALETYSLSFGLNSRWLKD